MGTWEVACGQARPDVISKFETFRRDRPLGRALLELLKRQCLLSRYKFKPLDDQSQPWKLIASSEDPLIEKALKDLDAFQEESRFTTRSSALEELLFGGDPIGGSPGRKTTGQLDLLKQKVQGISEIFDTLPADQQMAALDMIQTMVNGVVSTITFGKVTAVKFVPVDGSAVESSGLAAPTPEKPSDSEENSHAKTPAVDETSVKEELAELGETDEEEADDGDDDNDADYTPSVAVTSSRTGQGLRRGRSARWSADPAPTQEAEEPATTEENADNVISEADENEDGEIKEDLKIKEEPQSAEEEEIVEENGKRVKWWRCKQCNYSTKSRSNLRTHTIVHTGKRFKCDQCGKTFTANSSLKKHIMACHQGLRPHKCPICGKGFIDLASLRTHAVVHTGERLYECDLCSKSYTNSANLARHRRVHTGEMPYECQECGVRYRDLSSLKLHKLKHTGEKPYLCEVCNKQFKTASDFRRHERIHTGERNYQCKQCGKMFIQGWHLKQHQRMHEDYRPWQCELCKKRFRNKASLVHHNKGHAGIKEFTCPICSKSFSTKKYLRDHQVIHTSAKPFKCKVCGQDFNQLSNLKRHERIHSDRKPYKCNYCEKAFKYINSWRYHEGIHKGEKLTCEKCGLQFRSKHGIKRHHCIPENYDKNVALAAEGKLKNQKGGQIILKIKKRKLHKRKVAQKPIIYDEHTPENSDVDESLVTNEHHGVSVNESVQGASQKVINKKYMVNELGEISVNESSEGASQKVTAKKRKTLPKKKGSKLAVETKSKVRANTSEPENNSVQLEKNTVEKSHKPAKSPKKTGIKLKVKVKMPKKNPVVQISKLNLVNGNIDESVPVEKQAGEVKKRSRKDPKPKKSSKRKKSDPPINGNEVENSLSVSDVGNKDETCNLNTSESVIMDLSAVIVKQEPREMEEALITLAEGSKHLVEVSTESDEKPVLGQMIRHMDSGACEQEQRSSGMEVMDTDVDAMRSAYAEVNGKTLDRGILPEDGNNVLDLSFGRSSDTNH